jgi:hypothetical protein
MEKRNRCFYKQNFTIIKGNNKLLFALFVSFLLFASTTPIVFAATEDSVIISFDPDGDVDIDISLASYNFSSILGGMWTNTTGGAFTLYNNGTIPMDTQIKTNATTDETNMSLNASGIAPQQDEYAIYIDGLDVQNYLTSAYGLEFDTMLMPDDSKTFDICLLLGNLSANFTWQTTTIYFQGSIN